MEVLQTSALPLRHLAGRHYCSIYTEEIKAVLQAYFTRASLHLRAREQWYRCVGDGVLRSLRKMRH